MKGLPSKFVAISAVALWVGSAIADGPSDDEGEHLLGISRVEPVDLRAMFDAFERFEEAARIYRQEVQLLIEQKYDRRRDQLSEQYERAIQDLEVHEREARLEAIEKFERFVERYPREPAYSPDAMMRLAELHYEHIEDEHRLAERDYYQRIASLPAGVEVPPPPTRRFDRPMSLYKRIIRDFPQYQYADAAYYLLGYLFIQQDEFDSALATYDDLIQQFPRSRFVPEVWMRIGEYYFDADLGLIPDALELAIEAYHRALEFEGHHLYDKVLYKLAWTYYRISDYDNAVEHFLDLLANYQAEAEEQGKAEVGGDLREEAIQYAAASFADDQWGSVEKAKEILADRGHPAYEFDVLKRLGEILYDITRYPEAVETLKYVLARYPEHRDAPVIQDRIVRAWTRDRSLAQAFREQQVLVDTYARGSGWYNLHRYDREAISRAEEITERSLRQTALFHFQQAQTYRTEGDVELAIREYERSSDSISRYLDLYPHTEHLYDLEFYLADSLFWTGSFVEAADYYARVRDSNLDVEFQEPAALGAVESYEKEIAARERRGVLEPLETLTSGNWPEGKPVEAVPLP